MNVEEENGTNEEVPYDDIEYQADLAKHSVFAGVGASAGFGLLLSSVGALIALTTIGKIDNLDKFLQLGSLAAITIVLIVGGLAIIVPTSVISTRKINEARDKLREARRKESESKTAFNQSSSP